MLLSDNALPLAVMENKPPLPATVCHTTPLNPAPLLATATEPVKRDVLFNCVESAAFSDSMSKNTNVWSPLAGTSPFRSATRLMFRTHSLLA